MATGTLTGSTVAARYKSLLKLTGTANDVLGADASAKYIEDGDGNDSALSISTTRVGIGMTAPQTALSINKEGSDAGVFASGALHLQNSTTLNSYSQILFGYGSGSNTNASAYIGYKCTDAGAQGKGDLVFGTRASYSDVQPTERMRIDEDGKVGIGTTSPIQHLHIGTNATHATIKLTTNSTGHLDTDGSDINISSDLDLNIRQREDANIRLYTDGNERVRIDGDGNVGIGATAPGAPLEISNDSASHLRLRRDADDYWDIQVSADATGDNLLSFQKNGSTNNLCLQGGGNVGIGTTTPGHKLQVKGDNTYISVLAADGSEAVLLGADSDGDGAIVLADSGGNNKIHFTGNSGTDNYINNGGNVGIGEASPDCRLHVNETINVAYTVDAFTSDSNSLLKLENPSATNTAFSAMQFRTGDGMDMFLGAVQAQSPDTNDGAFVFAVQHTTDLELMRIMSSGNVGIGTNDPGELLTVYKEDAAAKIRIQKREVDGAQVENQVIGALEFWTNEDTYNPGSGAGDQALRASVQAIIQDTSSGTALQFFSGTTNGAAAERMRITAAGHVGIGASNPTSLLEVQSSATHAQLTLTTFSETNDHSGILTFKKSGHATKGSYTVTADDETLGDIRFYGADSGPSESALSAWISCYQDGGAGGTYIPTRLVFGTGTDAAAATERMRIDSSGNVGIGTGTDDPDGRLHVFTNSAGGVTASADADELILESSGQTGMSIMTGTGHAGNIFFGESSSNKRGYISYNGSADSPVDHMTFGTNQGDRMTIDSSGNVGIGTANANAPLEIAKDSTGINGGGYMRIHNEHDSIVDGDTLGSIYFGGRDGTAALSSNDGAYIKATASATWDTATSVNTAGTELTFHTQDNSGSSTLTTPRMIIHGDGSVQMGAIGAGQLGVLVNNDYVLYSYLAGTSAQQHMIFNNAGGDIGSIDSSGTTTSYNTTSDYRLKENEVTLSDGLARLKNLKPYRFNFKSDKDTTLDGFFAHEVAEVVPEAITGEKDAVDDDGNMIRQGIDHSKLVPLLVKAVQELSAKVTALENA